MGIDFICGCRCSFGGHWFLCEKHKRQIIDDDIEKRLNNSFLDIK